MNDDRRLKKPRTEAETDPNVEKKAVALRYNQETDNAPRVVAKGKGYVAENILAAAQSNSIPVYQNKSLVNLLMALDIDKEIPADFSTTSSVKNFIFTFFSLRFFSIIS